MPVVGFDFGTTNSLISVIQGNRAINILDNGQPFPSVVCYEGDRTIVGKEAKERLGAAGLGVQGNVVRSPKTLLGQESVFIGGLEKSPVDIVRDVVSYVRGQALASRAIPDLSIDKAVVTIPINMKGYRRKALRDAFRMGGLSIVQFIHEPLAALYGYLRSEPDYEASLRQYHKQLMLVADWGGGTLDLTLCRMIDGMLVQVINDGTDNVGGDIFDDIITNEIETRFRQARNISAEVKVQPSARTRLRHNCERVKIDLSNRSRAQIYVRDYFDGIADPDLDIALTRDELEKMVSILVDEGISRVIRLLDHGGYSPAAVALCLATGGISNMPVIKSRLQQIFGPQRVKVSDRGATLIAEGAAWVAHDAAPLTLAKDIELLLARNSFMPLVKAGTKMPREGQVYKEKFHLYCADPRDGHAKFQLQSPLRPGTISKDNEKRIAIENLVVKVHGDAEPLLERLDLHIRIDDDLILNAKAISSMQRDTAEVDVHNLEYGLALPRWSQKVVKADESGDKDGGPEERMEPGTLVIRSNIAQAKSDQAVPGELLYLHKPDYFDNRINRPQLQWKEKLYYTPCARCGRAINDPLCRCGI